VPPPPAARYAPGGGATPADDWLDGERANAELDAWLGSEPLLSAHGAHRQGGGDAPDDLDDDDLLRRARLADAAAASASDDDGCPGGQRARPPPRVAFAPSPPPQRVPLGGGGATATAPARVAVPSSAAKAPRAYLGGDAAGAPSGAPRRARAAAGALRRPPLRALPADVTTEELRYVIACAAHEWAHALLPALAVADDGGGGGALPFDALAACFDTMRTARRSSCRHVAGGADVGDNELARPLAQQRELPLLSRSALARGVRDVLRLRVPWSSMDHLFHQLVAPSLSRPPSVDTGESARAHGGGGRHRVVIRTSRERNARAAVAYCSVSSGKGAAGRSSCRCHRCYRRRRRRPPLRRRSESHASRCIRSEHRDSSPCAPLPDTTPPERHCRARVMAPPAARRPRAAAARRFAATRRWRPALPMPPPMRRRRRRRRRRRLRRRRRCARSSAPHSRRRAPTRRCHSIRARAAGRGASQRLRLWLSRRTRPGEMGGGEAPGPYTRPI